jgi:hypothetical protein
VIGDVFERNWTGTMIAMRASLLTGLLLLAAIHAAHADPIVPGPAERRSEDSAAAAERARDEVDKLRSDRPPVYDRRALPAWEDDLERAERREENTGDAAARAAREAEQAERRAKELSRQRDVMERREERDERQERRQREIRRHYGR